MLRAPVGLDVGRWLRLGEQGTLVVVGGFPQEEALVRRLESYGFTLTWSPEETLSYSGALPDVTLVLPVLDPNGDTLTPQRTDEFPRLYLGPKSWIQDPASGFLPDRDDFLEPPFSFSDLLLRVTASVQRGRRQRAAEKRAAEAQILTARLEQRGKDLLDSMVRIGLLLSEQREFQRLLEDVLLLAKAFCYADAGTLYLLQKSVTASGGDHLRFEIVRTDSLGIALGGATGKPISFPPLPLRDPDTGLPNDRYVATHVALTGRTVNIPDAYEAEGFDFSGTRAFDQRTGYRSQSFLTLPLLGGERGDGDLLGVIQLINATDPASGQVIPFDPELERMVGSLASLATTCLKAHLREVGLKRQLDSLRIEVDAARQARQVTEITESDYFLSLQRKASALRAGRR